MKRWAWPIAAAIAMAFIAFLAFHGERRESGLVGFAAAGPLSAWPVDDVVAIDVGVKNDHHSFRRPQHGPWRSAAMTDAASPEMAARIEAGLALLHNSAPVRVLEATELKERALTELGLDPPRLTITIGTLREDRMTIRFGDSNPLGLSRYAQIEGRQEVMLIPSYVAEAWETLGKSP